MHDEMARKINVFRRALGLSPIVTSEMVREAVDQATREYREMVADYWSKVRHDH